MYKTYYEQLLVRNSLPVGNPMICHSNSPTITVHCERTHQDIPQRKDHKCRHGCDIDMAHIFHQRNMLPTRRYPSAHVYKTSNCFGHWAYITNRKYCMQNFTRVHNALNK